MQKPRPVHASALTPVPRWVPATAIGRAYARRRITRDLEAKLHADGYRLTDGPCFHFASMDGRAVAGLHFQMVDTLAERYAATPTEAGQ